MSLHRRLVLAITLLMIAMLTANLVVTFHNARQNIHQQLQVHAQDTATSLGFSISQAALAKDIVQVSSMIDVIFDRGYYRRIVYLDLESNDVVRRELPLQVERVPTWFTEWLHLSEPEGRAGVSSGWFQLGEILVVSHPGFAYQDLWRSFKEQLWLYGITIVICYLLLGLGLRYILRPLRAVESQAEAITQREFREQHPLPNIPELRSVVDTMNRMVIKVKTMFGHQVELNDRLHQQLRTDEVTGLSNRRDFDERLQAYLKSDRTTDAGALLLIQMGDLNRINREEGRAAGDAYLHSIAQDITHCLAAYHHVLFSRHSGADFALFIPGIAQEESKELLQNLYVDLQSTQWSGENIKPIYMGMVYATNLHQQAKQLQTSLLTVADAALNQARNEQNAGYFWRLLDDASEPAMTATQWLELINKALEQKAFGFRYQPVWGLLHGEKQLLFNELLTHIVMDDQDYPARVFMPMALRWQLMSILDRKVVETIFSQQHDARENLCLNLSTAAIEDMGFVITLEKLLSSNKELASHLVFELPANSLSVAEARVRDFAHTIKRQGASLSLHHFGRGTAEFAFLQTLPLDYLKIDRCFIQQITEDADARFFVRSLITIAASCDVIVLAEGVESQAQWEALVALGIQGGQGYWLGEPGDQPVIG